MAAKKGNKYAVGSKGGGRGMAQEEREMKNILREKLKKYGIPFVNTELKSEATDLESRRLKWAIISKILDKLVADRHEQDIKTDGLTGFSEEEAKKIINEYVKLGLGGKS